MPSGVEIYIDLAVFWILCHTHMPLAPVLPLNLFLNPIKDPFNDWGGLGRNKFVPVFGGNGTKIAPTGDIVDQPPSQIRLIRGKLADHVGDHVVLSSEGAVLGTSPGTKSSYPRPAQSLNPSKIIIFFQEASLSRSRIWLVSSNF